MFDSHAWASSSGPLGSRSLNPNMFANHNSTSEHSNPSTQLQARTLIAPSRVTLKGAWHQAGDNFESRHTTAPKGEYDAEVLDSNGDLITSASENVLIFKPLAPVLFKFGHMLGDENKE